MEGRLATLVLVSLAAAGILAFLFFDRAVNMAVFALIVVVLAFRAVRG